MVDFVVFEICEGANLKRRGRKSKDDIKVGVRQR